MTAKTIAEFPASVVCLTCKKEKPRDEMMTSRRRNQGVFVLRPRCKACNNEKERGHRREWKRSYLRRWRKHHRELDHDYAVRFRSEHRQQLAARANRRWHRYHEAILIQGRLRRRLGMSVPIKEAAQMARTYGPAFPTRKGLTPAGLREYERIRSQQRRSGKKPMHPVEVRMMLYADGYYMKPSRQKPPFAKGSKRMTSYWQPGGLLRQKMATQSSEVSK